MIDMTDQVVSIVRDITGRAYRAWPQKAPQAPYAVISLIGRSVELHDHTGAEVRIRQTFSVSIIASKPSEASAIAGNIIDALAPYNLHNTGYSDTYETPNDLYRVDITVDGALDKRGHTFS